MLTKLSPLDGWMDRQTTPVLKKELLCNPAKTTVAGFVNWSIENVNKPYTQIIFFLIQRGI